MMLIVDAEITDHPDNVDLKRIQVKVLTNFSLTADDSDNRYNWQCKFLKVH